jgi:hypothetical protein
LSSPPRASSLSRAFVVVIIVGIVPARARVASNAFVNRTSTRHRAFFFASRVDDGVRSRGKEIPAVGRVLVFFRLSRARSRARSRDSTARARARRRTSTPSRARDRIGSTRVAR